MDSNAFAVKEWPSNLHGVHFCIRSVQDSFILICSWTTQMLTFAWALWRGFIANRNRNGNPQIQQTVHTTIHKHKHNPTPSSKRIKEIFELLTPSKKQQNNTQSHIQKAWSTGTPAAKQRLWASQMVSIKEHKTKPFKSKKSPLTLVHILSFLFFSFHSFITHIIPPKHHQIPDVYPFSIKPVHLIFWLFILLTVTVTVSSLPDAEAEQNRTTIPSDHHPPPYSKQPWSPALPLHLHWRMAFFSLDLQLYPSSFYSLCRTLNRPNLRHHI